MRDIQEINEQIHKLLRRMTEVAAASDLAPTPEERSTLQGVFENYRTELCKLKAERLTYAAQAATPEAGGKRASIYRSCFCQPCSPHGVILQKQRSD
jgi:hypothetical protein